MNKLSRLYVPIMLMALSACSSAPSQKEFDKGRQKYIDKQCNPDALVGYTSGIGILMDAKRKELESIKVNISFQKYNKLSQELAGYTVEYEILNQELVRACNRLASCEYEHYQRGADCRSHRGANKEVRESLLGFVVKIKELEIQ